MRQQAVLRTGINAESWDERSQLSFFIWGREVGSHPSIRDRGDGRCEPERRGLQLARTDKQDVTTKAPTRQMWRRSVIIMAVLVGFCFTAVLGKLAVLQIVQTDEWQKKAVSQQLSDSAISPNRGSIYDANMKLLAGSAEVGTIIMSPHNIPDDEAVRTKIADELSVLLEVDRERLYKQTLKVNSQYEIVKKKIEKDLVETFIQWVEDNGFASTGIFRIITDYKRYYPSGTLLSSVLGFVNAENKGGEGLEAYYNDVLAGKPGRIVTAQNGWGEEMPTSLKYESTIDAEQGHSLVLTIDQSVQNFAEKYLEVAVKETGAKNRGICIVMEVDTGAILAMATKGDYDPNEYQVIADPDMAAQIAMLSGDEKSQALQAAQWKQWKNKPVTDYYEPGSVFKTFTAAMALEEGIANENTTFHCPGYLKVEGTTIKCHVGTPGHGTVNFAQAISKSCNPYFMQLGAKIGRHIFFKYYTGFGFTDRTGIDMRGEARITSDLYHPEEGPNGLNPVELATCSIGQTFKVTPIQMITAMAAVANGGRLMQPYVVQQILDEEGNVVQKTEPTVKRQVISASTSQRLAAMMAASVNGGGAKNAYVAGYRVAGKTGTADKTETKQDVWASFSGFAPADDPKVAILVMLDEPQSTVRFGGTIAAPVAQKVLNDTLPYLGIEPKYTEEEIANMSRTTPKVEGDSLGTAQNKLANLGLEYKIVGSGETVLKQVPESGKSIPKGGTVVLYTEEDTTQKTAKVPDFKGMSVSRANAAAVNAGLNIQLSGLGLSSGEAKASGQSLAAGTEVPIGTVVTVEFVYEDNIE